MHDGINSFMANRFNVALAKLTASLFVELLGFLHPHKETAIPVLAMFAIN